jgi:NCAIR mutase (PurE)-related protein
LAERAPLALRDVLDAVARGELAVDAAERYLDGYGFIEVGFHRLDRQRERRTGLPEVIYGGGKTIEQLREIATYFAERDLPLLITKLDDAKGRALHASFPRAVFESAAGIVRLGRSTNALAGSVAVVSAGSSDFAVAEEAALTLDFFGIAAVRVYDCGVAGLHRLFASADEISSSEVVIAVAGMEGALPSVMAGIFARPIIAVPTSVGYGASFDGIAALLGMLNSCAPGVTVVNIDNGFGAAVAARSILAVASQRAAAALPP